MQKHILGGALCAALALAAMPAVANATCDTAVNCAVEQVVNAPGTAEKTVQDTVDNAPQTIDNAKQQALAEVAQLQGEVDQILGPVGPLLEQGEETAEQARQQLVDTLTPYLVLAQQQADNAQHHETWACALQGRGYRTTSASGRLWQGRGTATCVGSTAAQAAQGRGPVVDTAAPFSIQLWDLGASGCEMSFDNWGTVTIAGRSYTFGWDTSTPSPKTPEGSAVHAGFWQQSTAQSGSALVAMDYTSAQRVMQPGDLDATCQGDLFIDGALIFAPV